MVKNFTKKPMDNNTPPKEIYVSEFALAVLCKEEHTTIYINKVKQSDQITYLSEQSVNEMLAEKDKTIERLKECVRFVIDEPLYDTIHEIQHIRGLYASKRFTNAELSLARLCESLDDLMRIEPKKQ